MLSLVCVAAAARASAVAAPATCAAWRARVSMAMPSWVPDERLREIGEPAAQDAFANMQSIELTLPESVARGPVSVTYLSTKPAGGTASDAPPLLLVHGFDISSLEYRRLMPALEAAGIEAYAPCIPGWGFTETTSMRSVGVEGKRAALLAFWEAKLGGRPAVWVGASLGGCIALDCFLARPEAFKAFASLDPAFFTPPPPVVPAVVGRLLLQNVLSAPGVRESIAKQAYFVKEDQTEDAIRCGNLHLNRAQWEADSLEWLLGGAYGDQAPLVPRLAGLDTLTLWGREDEVVPPAGLFAWPAGRLVNSLKGDPPGSGGGSGGARGRHEFRWVEASGHTPHLEQPGVTAAALAAFARGEPVAGDASTADVAAAAARWDAVKASAAKVGGAAREKAAALGDAALARVKAAMEGE